MREVSELIFLSFMFAALLGGYADFKRSILPPASEIVTELNQDPIQQIIDTESYRFDYMGSSFSIFPRATYEIWGMVVARNSPFYDASTNQRSSPVDFKDLCVIWGSNLKDEIYREVSFGSDHSGCWYNPESTNAARKFNSDYLANNHLLSRSRDIGRLINSVNIGDQIYARGSLIDYCPLGYQELMRETSLVRTDSGPGACEVMMVDDFQILSRNQPFWNRVHFTIFQTGRGFIWLFVLAMIHLFFGPLFVMRKHRKKYEKVASKHPEMRKRRSLDLWSENLNDSAPGQTDSSSGKIPGGFPSTPLREKEGTISRIYELVQPSHGKLYFQPTLRRKYNLGSTVIWVAFFTLVSLFFFTAYQAHKEAAVFAFFAILYAIFMILNYRFIFDSRGLDLEEQKVVLPTRQFLSLKAIQPLSVKFSEVEALQIVEKYVFGGTNAVHCYELNVVTSGGQRYYLVCNSDKSQMISDAQKIARHISCDLVIEEL